MTEDELIELLRERQSKGRTAYLTFGDLVAMVPGGPDGRVASRARQGQGRRCRPQRCGGRRLTLAVPLARIGTEPQDGIVSRPETRYAKTADGVHIAYQVLGDGPFDLVYVPGWVSNLELMWEEPRLAAFLERLASFARLVVFDKRGHGTVRLRPDAELPGLERRMDDLRAVMDAAGSKRARAPRPLGRREHVHLFSATFPERTSRPRPRGVLREAVPQRRLPLGARSRGARAGYPRRPSGRGGGSLTPDSRRRWLTTRRSGLVIAVPSRFSASPGPPRPPSFG